VTVQTDGNLVLLRYDSGSVLTSFAVTRAQSLVVDGLSLVTITDGPASVISSGTYISLDRVDADFTIYGPGVSEIYYRTQQIHFLENAGFLTPDPAVAIESARIPRPVFRATAYPNPFNPATTIGFELAASSHVSAVIFDPLGRPVKRLAGKVYPEGVHTLRWDGTGDGGERVSSGVYFARLVSNGKVSTVKLTLLK
jgi:hypothetical protein